MKKSIDHAGAGRHALQRTLPRRPIPNRPIRLISPNPAGGANDVIGRIVAQKLGEVLGQQVVVDNRGGAGGTIGTEMAARAAPDGYTLFAASQSTITVAPHVYSKLDYDVLHDLAPVAMFAEVQNLLNTTPAFPPNTVKDLVALARAKPGAIKYASAGSGSASHFAGILFAKAAGIEFLHVPYKGGAPAITAVMSGEADFNFGPMAATTSFVKAGRLKAIAVSGSKRSPAFPNVPTVHRIRRAGIRGDRLVRTDGARGHAEGDRGSAARGDGEGRQQPRHAAAAHADRRGPGAQLTRRVREVRAAGIRALREADPRGGHQARVTGDT